MVKKLKLKKIGLSEGEFDELVVKKIVEENNIHFVAHFYELLDIDGDYFSDFFIWDYEYNFKNLDFIKDIRTRLLAQGKEEDEHFVDFVLDEVLQGDQGNKEIIRDTLFKRDFEYIVSTEIEKGKDSSLVDEIKSIEKELYKKLKFEMEVA